MTRLATNNNNNKTPTFQIKSNLCNKSRKPTYQKRIGQQQISERSNRSPRYFNVEISQLVHYFLLQTQKLCSTDHLHKCNKIFLKTKTRSDGNPRKLKRLLSYQLKFVLKHAPPYQLLLK